MGFPLAYGKMNRHSHEQVSKCHITWPYINPFPNKPWFLRVCSTSLLKTLWEKEKLLVMSNFSFSHNVFYPYGEPSAIFIKFEIVICKLSVWKSLKLVVWERDNHALMYADEIEFPFQVSKC